ncbi:hypothetical protein BUALT_Bualt03G0130000 [Buddleja alternifolia]|uniref:B3 domain-containing protein n=1 Tax=Buddleja alternifolia TaxID=168488 RepID=A0AAV6XTA5_9LAMI|nr:hypothetical protein BUALT_Bualt03G0130000 [Buddleja alternifolia]
MAFRKLTIEDVEDIDPTLNFFEKLAACSHRAKDIEVRETEETETKRAVSDEEAASSEAEARKKSNNKTTPKAKKQPVKYGPQPPPALPEEFKDKIRNVAGGRNYSEAKLVIQKLLYATDLNKTHNRLTIPIKQISGGFLNVEEEKFLQGRDEKGKNSKKVNIIEPSLEVVDVKLARWDMEKVDGKTSSSYALNGTWSQIKERNELTLGMVVQLWAFRIEGELYFALVTLPPA